MDVQHTDTTPEAPAPEAAAMAQPAETPAAAPQWDGEFDPERAARLVANLRESEKRLKEELAGVKSKLTEYEQAQMSEAEKIAARAEQAERELATLRREMAVKDALRAHNLPESAARFISGETPEEIAEAAEAFAALAVPATSTSQAPATLPVPGQGDDRADQEITAEDLERMSPDEIVRLRREGRLDHLLRGR